MIDDIDYALMAGAAYRSTRDANSRLPIPNGWTEIPLSHVIMPSGFEAVSFQHGDEIVITFAGTGPGLVDWDDNVLLASGFGLPAQLREAVAYYMEVRESNPQATISLTGHSLGGGLASLISVFFDEAAITFGQAPFRASANNDTRYQLIDYLADLGYTEGPVIDALLAFHSSLPAALSGSSDIPGIRGEENACGHYVALSGTDDRRYANEEIKPRAFSASDTGQTTSTHHWLSVGLGDDLLMGRRSEDGLVGGAGNNLILGDADYTAQTFDWSYSENALSQVAA